MNKPREECGVFGVFGHSQAAALTALGLHALQHRGQEACGLVTFDGGHFHIERHLGLVGDHFADQRLLNRLPGHAAIGHVRYSTQGGTALRNIQPIFSDLNSGGFAVAHNGNLTNARALRSALVNAGAIFQSTMDTEVISQLLARSSQARLRDRLVEAISRIEGGYSLVALTNKKVIGARDPIGLRPLILGEIDGAQILASETCALDAVGAQFVREIQNGEVIIISQNGMESYKPFPERSAAPCLFEYVYFSRPDSVLGGQSIYEVRKRMGRRLAQEVLIDADIVVPVPDSGVPAAIGYAEASGLPFDLGIIRNHYVGRTFIEPTQSGRQSSISKKHSANRAQLENKRVILIDDSIVRGNTSRRIVEMVRNAGAKEVHFLSASPQIKYPDFYGIDMPTKEELFCARYDNLADMSRSLNANSVGFLSLPGLYWALGEKRRDSDNPQYADHCFTGEYPTPLEDHDKDMAQKEQQLSFLLDD